MPSATARSKRFAALLLAALLAALGGRSQTARQSDLERLRSEITRLRQRLDDVRREASTAQQELEEADLELGIRTRELTIAEDARAQLELEQQRIQAQIVSIAPRIERQKRYLRKRLVALYRMGGLSYVRLFLSIDDRRDPLKAISMLSYLVSRDARAVSHFQEAEEQLSLRRDDLADRQQRLQKMQQVVADRRQAVAVAHAQKEQMLASLRVEESGGQKQLAELEEKARRLERLMATLARQQAPAMPAAGDVRGLQGSLPWPVSGTIVERFGRQRNAKFATVTTNNGVKIAAAAGAPVHAVFSGTVLFSQWFKGYGNLIIVDHGNRVFSLYGNLKAPAVAVNDRVAAGQAIAGVGESDDAKSGYLYFEIRNDNKPEDPQKWLR
jgi:septal ring factor EnvC (AmiA/AmiB activator)